MNQGAAATRRRPPGVSAGFCLGEARPAQTIGREKHAPLLPLPVAGEPP